VAAPAPGAKAHTTLVVVYHDDVAQFVEPRTVVGVGARPAPKLNPERVTDVAPECGALNRLRCVTTDESKVKMFSPVPTREAMVAIGETEVPMPAAVE
jgi:hypothetical protein